MPKKQTPPKIKKEKDLTAKVLSLEGRAVGEVSLSRDIFAAKINPRLVSQAVRVYLSRQRQGTVATKTRGEVAGSTRKIYRQKGTGRARHGSRKAPIFVGGGIIFGPKPRDFSLALPRKMRKKALFAALTDKFKNNNVLIVSGLEKVKDKTKEMVRVLGNLKLTEKDGKLKSSALLVLPDLERNPVLASRNIQNLTLTPANLLTTYLVLAHQQILFSDKAIEVFNDLWKKPRS